jgi:short-subunit dehydrogenase
MILKDHGSIVNISSLVGKFGTPYRSSYSASKHALHGYFDSLRAELSKTKIHIMIACPGFIKTNVAINALTKDGSPLKRQDQAQEDGMLPEDFAKKLIKSISKNKNEVYIGGKEILAVYLKRLLPRLFSIIIARASVR